MPLTDQRPDEHGRRQDHDGDLAHAIGHLAAEIHDLTHAFRDSYEWRNELKAMESRIIEAISQRSASDAAIKQAAEQLKASSAPLEAAVKANQP